MGLDSVAYVVVLSSAVYHLSESTPFQIKLRNPTPNPIKPDEPHSQLPKTNTRFVLVILSRDFTWCHPGAMLILACTSACPWYTSRFVHLSCRHEQHPWQPQSSHGTCLFPRQIEGLEVEHLHPVNESCMPPMRRVGSAAVSFVWEVYASIC